MNGEHIYPVDCRDPIRYQEKLTVKPYYNAGFMVHGEINIITNTSPTDSDASGTDAPYGSRHVVPSATSLASDPGCRCSRLYHY